MEDLQNMWILTQKVALFLVLSVKGKNPTNTYVCFYWTNVLQIKLTLLIVYVLCSWECRHFKNMGKAECLPNLDNPAASISSPAFHIYHSSLKDVKYSRIFTSIVNEKRNYFIYNPNLTLKEFCICTERKVSYILTLTDNNTLSVKEAGTFEIPFLSRTFSSFINGNCWGK